MNKPAIKVVKRSNKSLTEDARIVISTPKFGTSTQLKLVNIVRNWISERRENSRLEKVISHGEISAWKNNCKNSTE